MIQDQVVLGRDQVVLKKIRLNYLTLIRLYLYIELFQPKLKYRIHKHKHISKTFLRKEGRRDGVI